MRKVVVSVNVTLDGFMADSDNGLDWHFQNWSAEMALAACEQLSNADTILLGRITYEAMAHYWPSQNMNMARAREDIAFAEMMDQYAKVVFSRTLTKYDPMITLWNNSRLATKNISTEIGMLKKQPGRDLIVFGSGQLISALLKHDLIDECRLWVHPVLLGRGRSLFTRHKQSICQLQLFKTKVFESGVIILFYNLGR